MSYLNTDVLMKCLVQALTSAGKKVAVAESCTGGMLSQALTALAGASAYFLEGFVTYSNTSKTSQLGVSPPLIKSHGAVSAEVAAAMVEGVLQCSLADYALSITGVAGPTGGTVEKPVGLVWFGLASRDGLMLTKQKVFAGDRKMVRQQAVNFALQLLVDHIQDR